MSVQAKFKCTSVTDYGADKAVTLSAVTSGPGNESWAKYTPGGEVKLTITNPAAYEQFRPGVEYLLSFEEVRA